MIAYSPATSTRWLGRCSHSRLVLSIFFARSGSISCCFTIVPKGFFPEEDTGHLYGILQADQSASFQLMSEKLRQMMAIVQSDPAVQNVVGFTGANSGFGGSINSGAVIVSLKPFRNDHRSKR